MPGNNGNHGKKGRSGRKSLKDELAAKRLVDEIILKKFDMEEIDRVIIKIKNRKGRLSGREVLIAKVLTGNDAALKTILDKYLPSKVEHSGAIPVKKILDDELNDDESQPPTTGATDPVTPDHREQTGATGPVPPEQSPADVQPQPNAS